MAQSRTTKLAKLLLVMSTVLFMVPLVINNHHRFEGPPPPPYPSASMSMPMPEPREGMRHRERSISLPAGVADRKVMPMPAQVDDVAAIMPRHNEMNPHMPPPPHGHKKCAKGMLAAIVALSGIVAGLTESRRAVTVFMVVLALAFVSSTSMTILGAHQKVRDCRASHSVAALGRDFRPIMPQRPVTGAAADATTFVNADVSITSRDGQGAVNVIQPVDAVQVVEVDEVEIDVQVEAMPNRRAAKALHKHGQWGHGRRHGEMNANHGQQHHFRHHGADDCEHSVKHRVAHKVLVAVLSAVIFFVVARLLRKSIVADETLAAGAAVVATTKCNGEIYEGVPVKCAADDVVV